MLGTITLSYIAVAEKLFSSQSFFYLMFLFFFLDGEISPTNTEKIGVLLR